METVLLDQPMAGYLRRYLVRSNAPYTDIAAYSGDLIPQLTQLCQELLLEMQSFKIHVRVKVRFVKALDTETTCDAFFSNKQATILQGTDINNEIVDVVNQITNRIDEFCENGSGWTIDTIDRTDVHIARYQPLVAARSSYMELPAAIAKKRAIINVYNDDEECFKWSVLSALHPAPHNPHRLNHYRRFVGRYNFQDYNYPFSIKDIPRFENQHQLSIFVYGYENVVYPIYRPKDATRRQVFLLLLHDIETGKGHYCSIKSLNKLLHSRKKHGGKTYFCPLCLFSFNAQERLDQHIDNCRSDTCAVVMPSEEQKQLAFTATHKMLRQPCVFYADFECLLEPCDTAFPSDHRSFSVPSTLHTPCGYGLFQVIKCCDKSDTIYPRSIEVARGPDTMTLFLERLVDRATEYHASVIENRQPMPELTGPEWGLFFGSPNCHICEKGIEASCDQCRTQPYRRQWCGNCKATISRDHCHICRAFRGPTHAKCNLAYKLSKDVCVFVHNMKKYDSHLFMQNIAPFVNRHNYTIECIPKAMDSYVMFALNMIPLNERAGKWKIKFLDSFQFLSSSLDKLVNNLREKGEDSFQAMIAHYPQEGQRKLLLRKCVYPYEYVDDWNKFNDPTLPPIQQFYSTLTNSHISPQDYAHAQNVWDEFGIRTLGQYHDLYLTTDTLLLCDVIENFRDLCLRNYRLDPCHYVTLPSFGWDAVLRKSPVVLELLTDPDMYTFCESGIRGGVSTITTRYAKANNPMLPDYTDSLPSSFIASFDANNLYGYAMSQSLPVSKFCWMSEDELEVFDVGQIADDSSTGFILEVDLRYPPELHEAHNNYPLAPEHIIVSDDMLSLYSRNLKEKLHLGAAKQQKLVPNLFDKTGYIVHYRNLKLYLRLGMQIIRITRGIKFEQCAWMSPYIAFNTEQRKRAQSDFEKDLFKLLNNSVFGKSMENVRGYSNVELVTTPERMRKLVSNPRFSRFEAFDNDLVAVMLTKKTLQLKKPIYTGFTVLELSKHLMYEFHYDFIMNKFPDAKLLFTDTDSLTYHIHSDNIYRELQPHSHLFDFSDYPPNHFLFDATNKKVMGKMKDETNGVPIEEFVGLRSKMYSIKCDAHSKKRAKGVAKTIVKKQISHENYICALATGCVMHHNCHQIKNVGHQLFTMKSNKVSLSAYDDKRFILNNGISTVAYGHYMIQNCQNSSDEEDEDFV